eukprot:2394453-Alexandrium_andersonii.AAC.1
MSASLVGSEMCIRDSPRVRARLALAMFCSGAGARHARCFAISTCSGSVSYTHLTLPTICSV